jgi:hypothetical protein
MGKDRSFTVIPAGRERESIFLCIPPPTQIGILSTRAEASPMTSYSTSRSIEENGNDIRGQIAIHHRDFIIAPPSGILGHIGNI